MRKILFRRNLLFYSVFQIILLFNFPIVSYAQVPLTIYEETNGKHTATYFQVIDFYQKLDELSPRVQMQSMGTTDAGYPLHLVLFSNDGKFDPRRWQSGNKVVILINNGIHPGEPDGIDASMMWVRDLVTGRKRISDSVVLAFIPVYNIGGALNRSAFYRVDQDGPAEFGSRGNGQNLDLNRDFIKADSRNARSFAVIYQYLKPDIFIDNHVSNGADYQHIMTLISSQHNKLGGRLGEFMNKQFEPSIYLMMKERGYDLIPYVNAFGDTPETGWPEFLEGPRYSSGYATLFNSFAFVPETHMLKPYPQRVDATYALMECFERYAAANADTIRQIRKKAQEDQLNRSVFPVQWVLDRSRFTEISFKGYEAGRKPSAVSGLPRLYYDRNKPFDKKIKFYNQYVASVEVLVPKAYIIPQGWWKVIERLQDNGVKMERLHRDTILEVEALMINENKVSTRAFEGHYLNSSVKVSRKLIKKSFRRGDWLIQTAQPAKRFLVEVLEPEAMDSYFTWNFFDPILSQKEGFSSYVFEDTAEKLLAENPQLKMQLEEKRTTDTSFARNAYQQLDFIFKNSPYAEPDHNRYPVFRLLN